MVFGKDKDRENKKKRIFDHQHHHLRLLDYLEISFDWYMAAGRSSTYSRPTSSGRPMPPVGNAATTSSITRTTQSGTMNNTSTNLRQRPMSGVRQTSIDRTNIPIEREPTRSDEESPLASRLRNGGLTGLQNLGNTVRE